ncbi:diacylglycerol/lipid kinase family protein [Heyndrickxia ginsengihumi]|uniref:diacylglycerol/lipid kinase family protein n=1 Tax=Heyndrickxia ginsengihumi TaxID=363870 RepID=UPI003D1D56B1
MKEVVFIVNPAAKNGAALRTWNKIEKMLKEKIEFEVYYSKRAGHAKKLAAHLAIEKQHPFLLVAVGGDGTIHEVVNGIISHPHVIIAYIPAGSGNDFSRGYKLPQNPQKCARIIFDMMSTNI